MATVIPSFSRLVRLTNWFFNKLLAPEDKVSLHTCKRLLHSSPALHRSLTLTLSEKAAAELLFITINLANVWYQYVYASWFSVLLTSSSGLKKLFSVIIQDPVLGIFFYLSFYFRLLQESDVKKFDAVANALNLPAHADFTGRALTATMVLSLIPGVRDVSLLNKLLQKVILEQVVARTVESVPSFLTAVFQQPELAPTLKQGLAVTVGNSLFDEYSVQEFKAFLKTNATAIRQQVKKDYRNSKRMRKLRLQQLLEQYDAKGNVKCITPCKTQVKTQTGCFCEGGCGATLKWGKKTWCFVDPAKCKRGKHLPHFMGRAYDFCDNSNKTTVPKCYTGARYMNCKK